MQACAAASTILQVWYLPNDGTLMPVPSILLRVLYTELQEIW